MRLQTNFGLTLGISLGLLAALPGCGDDPVTYPNVNPNEPMARDAVVNVVHASPDTAAVDVFVDDTKLGSVEFRKSTGNLKLPAGAHKIALRLVGATTDLIPATEVNLGQDSKTLFTAVGHSGDTAGPSKLTLSIASLGTPDAAGVKLRVLHASPSAPAVDVLSGTIAVLSRVAFGSTTNYETVAKGALPAMTKLSLRVTGAKSDAAFVTVPGQIDAGKVVTAIAIGEINPLVPEDKFFDVLALDEAAGTLADLKVELNGQDMDNKASFVFVHAVADAPAADLTSDTGAVLAGNLIYKGASRRAELAGGTLAVELRPTGMTSKLYGTTLRLFPGTSWTLYATGLMNSAGAPEKALTLAAVPRTEKGTKGAWRILHAAPGLQPLTIDQTAIKDVKYPAASAYVEGDLPVGTLTLKNSAKSLYSVVVPQSVADVAQGQITTVIVSGLVGDMTKPVVATAIVESSATPTMAAYGKDLVTTATP